MASPSQPVPPLYLGMCGRHLVFGLEFMLIDSISFSFIFVREEGEGLPGAVVALLAQAIRDIQTEAILTSTEKKPKDPFRTAICCICCTLHEPSWPRPHEPCGEARSHCVSQVPSRSSPGKPSRGGPRRQCHSFHSDYLLVSL